jgi:thioester reductase-like protein
VNSHERNTQTAPAPLAALSGHLLLSGATGFLGAHLLQQLLEDTRVMVTCLVRGEDAERARGGLFEKLKWYFPRTDWAAHEHRVKVVLGDIGARLLGLDRRAYDELADAHSIILNAAANISHVGAPAQFFRANTESVSTLIDLAGHGTAKALHHISTVSVKGHFTTEPALTVFGEEHLEEGQRFPGAYAESKYRAEVLMRRAFDSGLDGAVYRVGYIGPHSETGRFQKNIHQHVTTRYVRACVELGLAPYLPGEHVRLTPVDTAARAILTLMASPESRRQTYFVDTPYEVSQYDIIRVLQGAGYPIRLLEPAEFVEKVPQLCRDQETLAAVMPHGGEGDVFVVPSDARRSEAELRRYGHVYPAVTSQWLGRFLEQAIAAGFLEAPRFWNLAPIVPGLLG